MRVRLPGRSVDSGGALIDHDEVGTLSQTRETSLQPAAVRAKFLQLWLRFPERYDADAAARLAEMIGEEKRKAILDVSMLSWLPIELDVEVVDAVARVMGPRRFNELTRAFFAEIVPKPPLGALLDLGTKMIGLSPQSCLRWWDRGWGAVYRNCGKVRGAVTGEGSGRVSYERMPRVCVQSEAFLEAVLSSSYGVYALTGYHGTVRIAQLQRDEGYLELAFDWRAKS